MTTEKKQKKTKLSDQEIIEKMEAKKKKITEKINSLKEKQRRMETHTKILLGGIVIGISAIEEKKGFETILINDVLKRAHAVGFTTDKLEKALGDLAKSTGVSTTN